MVKNDQQSYFTDYDKWGTLVSQAYSTPKPVLLAQEAKFFDENIFAVTASITNLDSKAIEATLQVWLTEDSVMGSQKKPSGTDKNYAHNHLLRASISPVWGDKIAMDAHITNQVVYEYTLPENVKKENCNIVSFVTINGEVVQAKETKLTAQTENNN